jgi:hypothetical protein
MRAARLVIEVDAPSERKMTMNAHRDAPTAADLATEANGLATGLGMLTMIYMPFALPGLVFGMLLLLPVLPLVLLAGLGYLLFVLPVRLARRAWRRRSENREISYVKPASTPSGIPVVRR